MSASRRVKYGGGGGGGGGDYDYDYGLIFYYDDA